MLLDINYGILIDGENAGLPTYAQNKNIEYIYENGLKKENPYFDKDLYKSQKLSEIESKILDVSMKLDKATSLNLQTQISELTQKLTELNSKKGEINAL